MPIDVTVATSVHAPRDVVARFTMDPRNDVAWIGGVQEAEVEGAEPFGEGSRVRRVASFLGKRIEYVNRVDELEPGVRLVMRSVKGPFPMLVTYAFGDEPDGATAVTVISTVYWRGSSCAPTADPRSGSSRRLNSRT